MIGLEKNIQSKIQASMMKKNAVSIHDIMQQNKEISQLKETVGNRESIMEK
jgi:hypothetical protein